jgi:hypothetical protein
MVQILGRLLDGTGMSAEWGSNTLTERYLVRMESPLDTVADVQAELPAYGATSEPTFTIGVSHHPEFVNLKLKSLNSLAPAPQGQPYWIVDVTYETAQWLTQQLSNGPREDQGKGNLGPKKKIDASGNPILYPWDEPPTWSASTRSVKQPLYKDASGNLLLHANKLPLTEGIEGNLELEVHQFTWNVPYSTFDYDTGVRPYRDKVNNSECFGKNAGYVYCEGITATENYRTQSISVPDGETPATDVQHHFVTLNATFVIDPSPTFAGSFSHFRQNYRRVSMHTQQVREIVGGVYKYGPIAVNGKGDYAEAPWPLLSQAAATTAGLPFGHAVLPEALPTANPLTDFHYIDALYPRSADLASFVSTHGLVIP